VDRGTRGLERAGERSGPSLFITIRRVVQANPANWLRTMSKRMRGEAP
jgi:hypothetical protein